MSVELPRGAGTQQPGENDLSNAADQYQPDPQIVSQLMEEGYGDPTDDFEFPNLPEISNMGDDGPGFFERVIPNFKAIMTSDDLGKTEIFQEAFKDDPRWGGAFVDKFGNPIIVWNRVPYYVNKPGLSATDMASFTGEVLKYIPASKFVAKAKTAKDTVMRGLGAYSATETASKIGEAAITPETVEARDQSLADVAKETGLITGIGVGADVVIPPIVKPVVEGGKSVIRETTKAAGKVSAKIGETLFPRFTPDVIQKSKYPLTQGQRTAEIPEGPTPRSTEQTGVEDELRRAQDSGLGTNIIRGFDDAQLDAIRKDALELQAELGANTIGRDGLYGNIPSAAAEETQSIVSSRAAQLKEEASALYQDLLKVPNPPMMTAEGVGTVSRNMLDIPASMGVTGRQLENMPILRSEITNLRRISKAAADPKFQDQALSTLHSYQKSLNIAKKQAQPGSAEEAVLMRMKSELDDAIYNGIEQGFIKGDQAVIDQLRNATGLYRQYAGLSGKLSVKDTQERAANKILLSLSNNNYTPMQVTNLLFGHNKFAPNQSVPLVLKELKKSLPPAEYDQVVRLLKDGILTKAFAGTGGDITRTAIVKNYNDVFNNQRAITELLFSPEEIARIKQFRKDVMPTLWAEIKDNPSGTSYKILSSLSRQNLLSFPSPMVRAVAPSVMKGVDEAAQATKAIDAVRQTTDRFQAPLLSGSAQALIRPEVRDEAEGEKVLRDLPTRERIKIDQGIDSLNQSINPENVDPVRLNQSNKTSMISPVEDADIFADLDFGTQPQMDQTALSSIVLPRDDDREIAMRRMARQSGIGGLV
tara:strand:+ start:6966 stop:9413 length:2448 start_codon:yes stop_codon:yes gene_type:complete